MPFKNPDKKKKKTRARLYHLHWRKTETINVYIYINIHPTDMYSCRYDIRFWRVRLALSTTKPLAASELISKIVRAKTVSSNRRKSLSGRAAKMRRLLCNTVIAADANGRERCFSEDAVVAESLAVVRLLLSTARLYENVHFRTVKKSVTRWFIFFFSTVKKKNTVYKSEVRDVQAALDQQLNPRAHYVSFIFYT